MYNWQKITLIDSYNWWRDDASPYFFSAWDRASLRRCVPSWMMLPIDAASPYGPSLKGGSKADVMFLVLSTISIMRYRVGSHRSGTHHLRDAYSSRDASSKGYMTPEKTYGNFSGAQKSIPRNRFCQPM
jgi:hypothetical protein